MDDRLLLRVLDEKGDLVETLRLDDVLAEFVGKEVRLTVAFAEELAGALRRSQPEQSQMTAISFDDLAKGD